MSNVLTGAPWLHAMARVFDNAGAALYLVGGAVRNPLMGLPVSDIDVCGPTRAEAVCALCEGTPVRAKLRAAAFGTVELYITDENGCEHMAEYTTWRQDLYLHGHRPEQVVFTTDIAVDASRRDFTVNALYQRVHADRLEDVCDPTGGLAHLKEGLLHTVKPNSDLVLGEDGQRILRAVRFQAELDLVPTQSMLESMVRNAPLLAELSCEMLRDELKKILMADFRYPALARRRPATFSGLSTLNRIGACPYLFGPIVFDEFAAALLSRLTVRTLAARLALLLSKAPLEEADAFLHRMRFSARDTQAVQDCLGAMHCDSLLQAAKLGLDALQTALAIFTVLEDETDAERMQSLLHQLDGKPMSLRELAVNGSDLQPIFQQHGRSMREMGAVLNELWQAVLEGRLPNERDALLRDPIATGGDPYP